MKLLRVLVGSGCVAFSVAALAGCSSSVDSNPVESPSAVVAATPTVSESVSSLTQASASASARTGGEVVAGDGAFESIPFEGSPAQWGEIAVDGTSVRAIVPQERSSAGGSLVWKDLGGYRHVEFSASAPDETADPVDLVVKVVTDLDRQPQVERVPAGSSKRISVDTSGASMLKIVWNVEGQPSAGTNVVFYDFEAAQ